MGGIIGIAPRPGVPSAPPALGCSAPPGSGAPISSVPDPGRDESGSPIGPVGGAPAAGVPVVGTPTGVAGCGVTVAAGGTAEDIRDRPAPVDGRDKPVPATGTEPPEPAPGPVDDAGGRNELLPGAAPGNVFSGPG
jgi:hypothetical protein